MHEQAVLSPDQVLNIVESFCREFANQSGDSTMGLQQLRLLLVLSQNRTLNQTKLPDFTGVAKSSNGRNIDRLGSGNFKEKGMGLLMSEEDPRDRRFKIVRLTKSGTLLLKQTAEAVVNGLPAQSEFCGA